MRSKEQNWFKRYVLNHLELKLLSIVAAFALFYFVRGTENVQRSFYVDVVTVAPRADTSRVLVTEIPDRVRLTLRGSRAILASIKRDDIPAIQIATGGTGSRIVYFEREQFEVPAGVEVVDIEPSSFRLQWERTRVSEVLVTPTFDGVLQPGLSLRGAPTITPSQVSVRGPSEEVASIAHVSTEPIDLGNLGPGEYVRTVPIRRRSTRITYEPETVSIRFRVGRVLRERSFNELAIEVIGATRRPLRPEHAHVVVSGTPDALAQISPNSIIPVVDLSAVAATPDVTISAPISIRSLPEGVEVVRIEPREVYVSAIGSGRRRPR